MTSAPDRKETAAITEEAIAAGARQDAACAALDLDTRTLQRWKALKGDVRADCRHLGERPGRQSIFPANRLTEMERDRIVDACNSQQFASLPPSQIVSKLAAEGRYMASESIFYRLLRERGQKHRRARAHQPGHSQPSASFQLKGPCEV